MWEIWLIDLSNPALNANFYNLPYLALHDHYKENVLKFLIYNLSLK